ncbi:hypothetical protein HMPREF1544_07587 [Mucor circinelloides 1006PhL]|uniref:AB hydrolase-1 domain-containing protein n=1 Tax=Mucor circinelloides f. circinelloides (strain 1006PhL) TaxID=1220926 RepID=S2J7F9_MUCC1|nr:hypothetical protein HMPREF1544_07587 [Mucor circinelloides 1006PhL]
MIVTGAFDNLVHPEYSYPMKKILQAAARFELFEGRGRAIFEEQPERYNSSLVDHISTPSSNKRAKL